MGGRVVRALAAGAIVALCVAAGILAAHHRASFDASEDGRHSLSPQSRQALDALPDGVQVTAFAGADHPARTAIAELVARYRRHAPSLALEYIDPADVPDRVRRENLRDGELLIASGERQERLLRYREQDFTRALLRLIGRESRFIVFVSGHGERSPARSANFDVSHWAGALRARGYQVQELALTDTTTIPDNTALLVLASPQLAYLPGEQARVAAYVARGGALLWLLEPDAPAALDGLARALGVERLPATVVDPVTQALGVDNPAIAVLNRYPDHPVTRDLRGLTLLPYAVPLRAHPPTGWNATTVLETTAAAWGETGAMVGNVGFDAPGDHAGPLALGIVLTRTHAGREQRIALLGDGDFLSNTYLGNGENQALGVRLVDWLSTNDPLLAIDPRHAPDVGLDLTRGQQAVIGFGFLVVLPLAFVANGAWLGWRRRRA